MKSFLVFLSLGSSVLYTLLVIVDTYIPDGIADNTLASEAHSNQHRLSAWGPYLSPGQDRRASTITQPTHQHAALAPKRGQYFDDVPSNDKLTASEVDDDQIGQRPASLLIAAGLFEPSINPAFPGYTPSLLQTTQLSTASGALLVEARAPPPVSPEGGLKAQSVAESNHSEQMVARSLAMVRRDTETTLGRAQEQRAPLPPNSVNAASLTPVPEDEKEEAIWVVVVRWATVHSDPSVSAPTLRFYPVGTELQVVDYQRGWFQVLSAATSQRGWIYEKYYLHPIRGPGQMIAVSDSFERTPAALEGPKPRPNVKRVKKSESQKRKKIPPRIASARVQRESVANIMDRAIRR